MTSIFTRIAIFLEDYKPGTIVFKKDMLRMNVANHILETYLYQLCKAEYLEKLDKEIYKVIKKVSPLTSIANIMLEGDEIAKKKKDEKEIA
jgi:UTP:GlnB (protein PII) uridylyltransferase